jgi:hypothetical protein
MQFSAGSLVGTSILLPLNVYHVKQNSYRLIARELEFISMFLLILKSRSIIPPTNTIILSGQTPQDGETLR